MRKSSRSRAHIVNLADIWMIQRGDRLRFTSESFRELVFRYFDRYVTIKTGVPPTIDFAHATRADRGKDLIRAEFGPNR